MLCFLETATSLRPQPRAEILGIDAYIPRKSHVAGVAKVHELSSKESPLGPSPAASDAFREGVCHLPRYPDCPALALREATANRFGFEVSRIICGNGSDEILALLGRPFLGRGEEGVYSKYGFLEYPICIRAAGAVPVVAAETNKTLNVDAILAKISARTRIVFIASPNNPTGTYVPYSELERIQAGHP